MLLLTSTTDILTLITGSAGQINVKVDYMDNLSGTVTPGHPANLAAITTATTTTICSSPAASTQRNIKCIIINNTHASINNLVTVNHSDGTTVIPLYDVTLLAGESVCMADDEWIYYDVNGAPKLSQGVAGPIVATTLTASGAVTLSPANAAVAISPSGTGTVTISPVGAMTVNPTAASTINNTSVGATTRSTGAFSLIGAGGASAATSFLAIAAGTTTVASISCTGGTLLTTAAAGAIENDAICMYATTNITDGRGIIPTIRQFRLTANGAAFNTISNFFGTTSNVSLVASAYYEINIELYYTKTTAEAVTWTFTNSAAPTSMNIHAEFSPVTGVSSTPVGGLTADIVASVTAAQTIVTGTLTTAVNHYARFKIFLKNGTGTSLKIQAACATASGITPLLGSRWTSLRIPTANTGTFAA